jgi:uncharacterized protein YegP (UPF0339 family)
MVERHGVGFPYYCVCEAVRLKVYEPEPLAAVRQWRWELVGRDDKVLAASPKLASRADCENAMNQIRSAFERGEVGPPVMVPAKRP